MTYSEGVGSTLSNSQIENGAAVVNAVKQPLSAVEVSEINESHTILAQRSYATLSIENDDIYLNNAETQSSVKFLVDVSDGYTVTSVRVGNVALTGSSGEYTLNVGDSNLSDGTYQVVVELADAALSVVDPTLGYEQSAITLTSDIILDTSAPMIRPF